MRESRCVETLIRCIRVAADEMYLDPSGIRCLAWTRAKREMNGPEKLRRNVIIAILQCESPSASRYTAERLERK